MIGRTTLWILLSVMQAAMAADDSPLSLAVSPERVELTNGPQKAVFAKDASGRFVFTTSVRTERGWRPLFDGAQPILTGQHFDLFPTAASVIENSRQRVSVLLSGTHQQPQ